ncbi:calcium uniporter protein 4, mitochondrial [Salvia miltiorrhiza]|uniref:calcium uniporter protein 4, mitochondrial n=1 Tax=Salvia miltiorrhiza TaxID=226208 RepID=UPI0025AD95DF|nr:calcium uniporter protein 4, mitochondrial [Salvia miltiorrhiza]
MALRRSLSKRLFSDTTPQFPSPIRMHSPSPPPSPAHRHRGSVSPSFFRRFLQRRALNNHSAPNALPSILSLPVGDKLREKLKSMSIAGHQLPCLGEDGGLRVSAADAKRVLRFVKLEVVRERLRNIPATTLPYPEFVRICVDACGCTEMGAEFAKTLDHSGNVIVLGAVVFLRPDQVAKSMEALISQSIAMPSDPRRRELGNLEQQKSAIDEKARSLVRAELYCGLGFLALQTLGFMRLTFWELSWDVMEPICFFVTSLHFALAYAFFLRTSTEPSFEGYFQSRFKAKQHKLIKLHNFDVDRYNKLCEAFYPNRCNRKIGNGPFLRD